MQKFEENENAVELSISSKMRDTACEHWNTEKLENFMPPFLNGYINFEDKDKDSFVFRTTGIKNQYPQNVHFYAKHDGIEATGCIVVQKPKSGVPKIHIEELSSTSKYDEYVIKCFVFPILLVFGEYNYQKANRKVIKKEAQRKLQNYQKKNQSTTQSVHTECRKMLLNEKEVSKPFVISDEKNLINLREANGTHNYVYTISSWPSAGYYRKNGLYVHPCIKHRDITLLS